MDEFYIGQMVDTPDGIGEVIDLDEDLEELTVELGRGDTFTYNSFECTPLDEDSVDFDLDDDSDFEDDFAGDDDEARAEFGDDEEDDL